MNKTTFNLLHAVRLIPIKGETQVTVETNGICEIKDLIPKLHEPKYRLLAGTLHGRYYRSRGGLNRIIKITLPAEVASKEKFVEEMFTLFNILELHKGFNHDAE